MIEIFKNSIIPVFNIIFGLIMFLTGIEKIKPFKEEKEADFKKYKLFFILGGIGMFIWGLINLL
jgi:hypothetical protein